MKSLNINKNKIALMVSYIGRNKAVSLDDYVYYTKLAWEVVGYDMAQSNFSKIFMKNSKLLQSKMEMFRLDSGIEVQAAQF